MALPDRLGCSVVTSGDDMSSDSCFATEFLYRIWLSKIA